MKAEEKRRLRIFVACILILLSISSGFGSAAKARVDDQLERGRALQQAAISAGSLLAGILLLVWNKKKTDGCDNSGAEREHHP